jgi:hypothetical protein
MTASTTFTTGRKSGIDYLHSWQMTTNPTVSGVKADKGVQVLASVDNSVSIYVGPSGVTANSSDTTDGYPLAAGESILVPVRNATEIFLIAGGSGTSQKVWWIIV